ncbi:MAG: carboxypeptidase regulatory-like domain-containing protein [Acidobacteriia bacterium]|nr:carboxypeptidase regulatory-like domain-containing protein [Terriglobia bacterium]
MLRIFMFALLLAVAASAQESRASLTGVVTDQTQAAVAGAAVKLTNSNTGVVFDTTTNSTGEYRFLFLNPGTYQIKVELTGFRALERTGIALQVGQSAAINLSLQLGALAETVTVTSNAALLETEKSDRGVVVDKRRITDLPLNVRNPIMLTALSPGVTQTGGQAHLNPFSNSGISSWSVNGGLTNNTEFIMDGAPNNAFSGRQNRIAYVPPADAVEEFKVLTTVYDAQYGKTGGGVINVSSKSGTNSYHGSAYEFLKRPGLNANTFSNNSKGLPRQRTGLDQWGFTIGGPIRLPRLYNGQSKTFFFFSGEAYHEGLHFPDESITSVPTVAQKAGDFSRTFDNSGRLMPIYDPITGRQEGNNWVRDPFPGNRIPAGRINPSAAKIASLYPDPNSSTPGSPDWQNNFVLSPNPGLFNFHNYNARVDHNVSSRHRLYGRWSWNRHESFRIKNAIPGIGADHQTAGKTNNGIVLDWVSTLNSSTIFNLRSSLTRWQEDLPGFDHGFNVTQWGWPESLARALPISSDGGTRNYPTRMLFVQASAKRPSGGRPPYISVNSYGFLGSNSFLYEPTNVFSFHPNVAIIRGRNTIKAGFDYRLSRFTDQRPEYAASRLDFDRAFTRQNYLAQDALSGNGIASLLLGFPAGGRIDNNVFPYYQTQYAAPWIQDDFKVTRRLTLNLGLRWDINIAPTERFNRSNYGFFADTVNPISDRVNKLAFPGFQVKGGIGFAGVNGQPRSPFANDYGTVQPRIGAAFQINTKTVMRGGYGMFFTSPVSRGFTNGFSIQTPYVASLDAGRTPANNVSNPFPQGVLQPPGASLGLETFLGQSPSFTNPNFRTPYIHQLSFGFQRELPFGMTLDLSYVGSRTHDVEAIRPFNELPVEALALGSGVLNQSVPNPFQGLINAGGLGAATVPRQQLLRPYPQFASFNSSDRNEGRVWYNSMQLLLEKRYSHGLTFLVAYTLSKNVEALIYLNGQDSGPTRTLTAWDRPHRMTIAPMYELPFGPGRKLLNGKHPVVSRLVGGWQTVLTTTLTSGAPMSIPGDVYLLGDPRLENPTWSRLFKTGVIDVNGTVRNVLPGEEPVFRVRPPFTLRTTPLRYGNLRNQWGTTFDFSILKSVRVSERIKAQFRVEAFNVLNTPIFSANPNLTPTSVNFGQLFRDNGQSNGPRIVQLGFRLEY